MSFFNDDEDDSDDHYYDPQNKFQKRVLRNAEKLEKHPLAHLAVQLEKGVDCMDEFCSQDPHLSKSERIAIQSDIAEATEALSRACTVIPQEVTEE